MKAQDLDRRRRRAGAVRPAPRPRAQTEFCNAEPGQLFVGQKADAASGLAIRQATGADTVRWAPPRTRDDDGVPAKAA